MPPATPFHLQSSNKIPFRLAYQGIPCNTTITSSQSQCITCFGGCLKYAAKGHCWHRQTFLSQGKHRGGYNALFLWDMWINAVGRG